MKGRQKIAVEGVSAVLTQNAQTTQIAKTKIIYTIVFVTMVIREMENSVKEVCTMVN